MLFYKKNFSGYFSRNGKKNKILVIMCINRLSLKKEFYLPGKKILFFLGASIKNVSNPKQNYL